MIAGLVIIETALILGVDGAAMVMGGTLLGLPIGAGVAKVAAAAKK